MVRLTLIYRVHDGLPLAEGLDNDKDGQFEQYKAQARTFLKKLAHSKDAPPRMSIELGSAAFFHVLIASGVCFLTLADKGYPKKLAYQYLEELSQEFHSLYGPQIEAVHRPYAFIKFDNFIQKTKKLYLDTRTQRNLTKLNEDISEVHSILTRNIAEVLGQGERLSGLTSMSATLSAESKQYAKKAKQLHFEALVKKYVPVAVLIGVVLLVLWVRSYWYS